MSPLPPDLLPTDEEIALAVAILGKLTAPNGGAKPEFKESRCRPLRLALQPFLDDVRGHIFSGSNPEAERLKKQQQRAQRAQAQKELERDRKAVAKSKMWAERVRMRDELERDEDATLRIADGAVEDRTARLPSDPMLRLASNTDPVPISTVEDVSDAGGEEGEQQQQQQQQQLHTPAACYTCKERFRTLHHFYAKLCPPCADLNFQKRNASAAMAGRLVLVTGARVKIGYHVVLKLLRAGATVLATTRFPVDCARRFAALEDFGTWGHNLRIYGIDLRDLVTAHRAQTRGRAPRGAVAT